MKVCVTWEWMKTGPKYESWNSTWAVERGDIERRHPSQFLWGLFMVRLRNVSLGLMFWSFFLPVPRFDLIIIFIYCSCLSGFQHFPSLYEMVWPFNVCFFSCTLSCFLFSASVAPCLAILSFFTLPANIPVINASHVSLCVCQVVTPPPLLLAVPLQCPTAMIPWKEAVILVRLIATFFL